MAQAVRASVDEAREDQPLLPSAAAHHDAERDAASTAQPGGQQQQQQPPHSLTARVRSHLAAVFGPLQRPDSLRPLERFLLLASLLLLLLLALFVGLFAGASHRIGHPPGHAPPPPPPPHHPPPPHGVCTTPACVRTAASILDAIDESVHPCDDFYDFATRGWRRRHPIPADAGLFGMAQAIADDNAKTVQKFIDDAPAPDVEALPYATSFLGLNGSSSSSSDPRVAAYDLLHDSARKSPGKHHGGDDDDAANLAKLRDYYDSCVDVEAQNKRGNAPLLDFVARLHDELRFSAEPVEDEGATPDDEGQDEEEEVSFTVQHAKPVPPNRPPGRSPVVRRPTRDRDVMPPLGGRQAGLTRALAYLHANGVDALFEFFVDGEPVKDPTFGVARLAPSGLGFPDKAYYDDEDELAFYEDVVTEGLVGLAEAKRVEAAGTSASEEDGVDADEEEDESHKDKKKKKKGDKDDDKKKKGKKDKKKHHHKHHDDDDDDDDKVDRKRLRALAKRVVEFEAALADITPDGESLSDPLGSYNPTSLANLSYSLTSVDWKAYFHSLGTPAPEELIVLSPEFVRQLDHLLSRTRDGVLRAYLEWSAVRNLGLQLGEEVSLRAPAESLERRSSGVDARAPQDRARYCQAKLNEALGFLAGRYFVRDAFPPEAKRKFERVVRGIVGAFKERLPELDWLDAKTRRFAEKKADAVRVKIGYPTSAPDTEDAGGLREWYADLEVRRADWFGNALRSLRRGSRREWRSEGHKLDPERWDMFPAEVNAYYNPGGNEIVFPAGILQPMYYSYLWPDYLQYGVGGSVAGHELSHAFDPDGRLFDEKGRLYDWWTPETAKAFNERRDCLVAQYGNYTISDGKGGKLHLRSRFTIGEDVADAGGVAQSWRAWRDSLERRDDVGVAHAHAPGPPPPGPPPGKKDDNNALLPGLEKYTREQLFFIGYAIGWARNIRTGELVKRLRTDPHSPTIYRVIGTLSNDDNFQEAFGCKPGQAMYRPKEERCQIW